MKHETLDLKTGNSSLAAYLLVLGYEMDGTEHGYMDFRFIFNQIPKRAIDNFWNNFPVPIQSFEKAKGRLYRMHVKANRENEKNYGELEYVEVKW